MGDPETKYKRSQQRKRNIYAKVLEDAMFRQRKVDPRKQEYKRVHLHPKDIKEEDDSETIREDFD